MSNFMSLDTFLLTLLCGGGGRSWMVAPTVKGIVARRFGGASGIKAVVVNWFVPWIDGETVSAACFGGGSVHWGCVEL